MAKKPTKFEGNGKVVEPEAEIPSRTGLSAAEERAFKRERRQRMIHGEIDFDLGIDMLGVKIWLPIKVAYGYMPDWPVFNARTGRDMPAVHCDGYSHLDMSGSVNREQSVRARRDDKWITAFLNGTLWRYGTIEILLGLIHDDAERKDKEARKEFARRSSRAGARVIKFPGAPRQTEQAIELQQTQT